MSLMLSGLWKYEKEKEENTNLSGLQRQPREVWEQEGWLLNKIEAKEDPNSSHVFKRKHMTAPTISRI